MSKPCDGESSALSILFRSPLVVSVLCPLSVPAMVFFMGVSLDRARLWHLLMAVQSGLWLASIIVVFNEFNRHRLDWPSRRSEWTAVVLCTLLAWVMNSFPHLVQLITQRWGLPEGLDALLQFPHARAKLILLGMLSAAVSTLHIAGMVSVHVQLLAYPREPTARGEESTAGGLDGEVLRYQRLRSRLERALLFSAAIMGLAVLSLGAYRSLLKELAPSHVIEPSSDITYGIYYTAILASIYLPTRKTLTDVGEALAARFVRQAPAAGTTWKDWSQEQQAVRTWLGLQNSTLRDFQQGLSVLTPLLASLSALALGAGG